MNSNKIFIFIVLCGLIAVTTCQTFTYSRGWTNGKRSIVPIQLFDQNNQQIRPLIGPDGGNSELKFERLLRHLRQMAIYNENFKNNLPSDYDFLEPMPIASEERIRRNAVANTSH